MEITRWLGERRADQRFARFTGHFAALDSVFARMLDAIEAGVANIDVRGSSGQVYEQCRNAEVQLSLVRRTHEWYAHKYDQRTNDTAASVLRAADEVVRSCWVEAFAGVDHVAPTGPLVYMDSRFDAVATPRMSVPTDLRAPRDAVISEFVRQLPIPIIALPAISAVEPWWIVLAAHETGHHVQYDLARDLIAETRDALDVVASQPPLGDSDSAACWAAWALEIFADTFATLMVGPAAAWAVIELQHGAPARLVTPPSPGQRYPPAVVRTALLGELARAVGIDDPGPGEAEVLRWLDTAKVTDVKQPTRDAVAAQVRLTPVVARTMVELPVAGAPLHAVCGWVPGVFGEAGPVAKWRRALQATAPTVSGREEVAAARHGIAGGVAAYRLLTLPSAETPMRPNDGRLERLRVNLPTMLQTCGPPGTLAGKAPVDVAGVADRLTAQLLAIVDDPGAG